MNRIIQEQALIAEARFKANKAGKKALNNKRDTLDVSDIAEVKKHIKQL
jgi:hypothetical protein